MDYLSFLLSRDYIEDSLKGSGALQGKSAYEIAVENGFSGSEKKWLNSLQGISPHIGANGNWFLDKTDTGVRATPDLTNIATKDFVISKFNTINLLNYITKEELFKELEKIIIPDVSKFMTEEEIHSAIENAIPKTDFSIFVTYEKLTEIISQIKIPDINLENYATKEYVIELIESMIQLENNKIVALSDEEILKICK